MSKNAAQPPAADPAASAATSAPQTPAADASASAEGGAAADGAAAADAPAAAEGSAAAPEGEAAAKAEQERIANLRKARRIPVRFPAGFHGRRVEGKGMVSNISATGCLIEDADPLVVAGGEVKVRFSLFDDSLPFELRGQVVRETPNGFAVRFTSLDARTRQVLSFAISRATQAAQNQTPEPPSTAAPMLQPWRQKGSKSGS